MLGSLQVFSHYIHLYVVLVLVLELSTYVFLVSSFIIFHVKEPSEAAPVKVFWNICANISFVAPKGCIALMYIFKWDLGQLVPSSLSKTGILNFGGSLTFGKREREWLLIHEIIHPMCSLDHFLHLAHLLINLLLTLRDRGSPISLVSFLTTLQIL